MMARMAGDDPRTDDELVDAANAGDPDAFEAIYRRYRDWVGAVAHRLTGSNEDALDILQDTFIWLLKQFPGFTLRAPLKAVLYRVIRNSAIARGRKEETHQSHFERIATLAVSRQLDDPPTARPESLDALARSLDALPDAHREVLLLRFADDLSLEAIAAALEIPLGTVKSRLHHAVRALRENEETKKLYFD